MEVKVTELDSITCDKCGKTYSAEDDRDEVQEFHYIDFVGGYGSVFGDGTKVECEICQYCLKKMIEKFMRTEEVY